MLFCKSNLWFWYQKLYVGGKLQQKFFVTKDITIEL